MLSRRLKFSCSRSLAAALVLAGLVACGGGGGGGDVPEVAPAAVAPPTPPVAVAEPGHVDGLGNAARFNKPMGLALDEQGTLYVADTGNGTIRVVSPTGAVTTIPGLGGSLARYAPSRVAVDSAGNLYLEAFQAVKKLDLSTKESSSDAVRLPADPCRTGCFQGPYFTSMAIGTALGKRQDFWGLAAWRWHRTVPCSLPTMATAQSELLPPVESSRPTPAMQAPLGMPTARGARQPSEEPKALLWITRATSTSPTQTTTPSGRSHLQEL